MERDLLIKRASYASIITGVIILIIKIFGWIKSDSIALFASLVDSLLDITSSCINAIAIQIALSPPDNDHRFGHNKVQDLAIFGQSVFFISSGAFTMFISLKKIAQEHTIQNFEQGIISMALCTVLCLILVAYQSYVIKKTNSSIIKSDRVHYGADSASDVAVMEESMNFLTEDDINIDEIEFIDFETGDDDPDSEDEDPPSGLGLNGFINSIKGGKKLRKRMRKAMANQANNLGTDLKATDPNGKYTSNIAPTQN